MTKPQNKKIVFLTKLFPKSGYAWIFTFVGFCGCLSFWYYGSNFGPDDIQPRIETKPDGTEIIHWINISEKSIMSNPETQVGQTVTPIVSNHLVQDTSLEAKFDFAVKAVNRGDWTNAENYLKAYITEDPARQLSYYLLGYVQKKQNEYDQALQNYLTYLDKNPNSKYRFSAACELYSVVVRLPGGCNKYYSKIKEILFSQRKNAFDIDENTGLTAKATFLLLLKGRSIELEKMGNTRLATELMQWRKSLSEMTEVDYQSEKAGLSMPKESSVISN